MNKSVLAGGFLRRKTRLWTLWDQLWGGNVRLCACVQTSRRCVCVCVFLSACVCVCVCVFAHTSHLFDLSHPSCASPLNSNISDILCVIYKWAAAAEEEATERRISVSLNPSCNIPAGRVNVCDEYSRLVNNSWGLQRLRPHKRACPIRGPHHQEEQRHLSHVSFCGRHKQSRKWYLNWSEVT